MNVLKFQWWLYLTNRHEGNQKELASINKTRHRCCLKSLKNFTVIDLHLSAMQRFDDEFLDNRKTALQDRLEATEPVSELVVA